MKPAQAQRGLKHLKAALRSAARHPGKEKSIHDLRVTIRRFKQVLRVYSGHFTHARKMRHALRALMALCGPARNCDVALTVLEAAGVPADRTLKHALAKRRTEATHHLARKLKDWHIRSHMHRWSGWLHSAGDAARPAAPRLSGDFRKSGVAAARAGTPYPKMHKFRLLVKKTRYASEILGASNRQVEELRALQDLLGAINDCVTTAGLITEMKLKPAQQRRIKAALNRLAESRAAEFRTHWREHFAARRGK